MFVPGRVANPSTPPKRTLSFSGCPILRAFVLCEGSGFRRSVAPEFVSQPLFEVRRRLSLRALSRGGFGHVLVGRGARDKADILKNSGVINGVCADFFQYCRKNFSHVAVDSAHLLNGRVPVSADERITQLAEDAFHVSGMDVHIAAIQITHRF